MDQQTPSPYQPGSFEHAVITGIAQLQTKMEGVSSELKRQNDTLSDTIEKVHQIQIDMAERQSDCVVAKRLETKLVRRITPLEKDALVAKANKKADHRPVRVGLRNVVFVYHLLHSIKAFRRDHAQIGSRSSTPPKLFERSTRRPPGRNTRSTTWSCCSAVPAGRPSRSRVRSRQAHGQRAVQRGRGRSRAATLAICSLPDNEHAVARENAVTADERAALRERLSNQHAVERIPMPLGKRIEPVHMGHAHG
jgi:hypothetical protein